MPKKKLAYKPVADPESLLLPWPKPPAMSRLKPPLPDPKPTPELFLHSLLMPGKSMLDVSAVVPYQAAGAHPCRTMPLLATVRLSLQIPEYNVVQFITALDRQ